MVLIIPYAVQKQVSKVMVSPRINPIFYHHGQIQAMPVARAGDMLAP